MIHGKMVLAGGTGFLGRILTQWFGRQGFEIITLSRKPEIHPIARTVHWDGQTIGDRYGLWQGVRGVFEVLSHLTRLGLGGKMTSGKQYVSWIHEEDFCRAIEWLLNQPHAEGVYNITSPNPVPNREMMAAFREVYRITFGLPASRIMLEIGAFFMRTETELIIKSRRIIPRRLLDEGFTFSFPHIREAIANLAEIRLESRI
jgi:NAD dependent epimerase/dehydratase family enzyme